jgi:UDP-glucose 6-dehydrogenase
MNVTVVGTGYVGLVAGACFADAGNHVVCLDLDAAKVAKLNAGGIPIYEPGLEAIVQRNRAAGRLAFTTDVAASVAHGELQLIAVGTPPDEDGSADLQHVLAAARAIGRHMNGYRVIVNKSTVPVGTADKVRSAVAEELARRGAQHPFSVVSNPEFLKEGAAIEEVRKGIGSDPRIGFDFLYAGAGFGGSCFPKDVKALLRTGDEAGRPLQLLGAVEQVNEAQKHVLGTKIKARFGGGIAGKRIALWGLAFKPNTDDMREASSRALIADLLAAGATISAYDPVAGIEARKLFANYGGVRITDSAMDALAGCDALAIVTEWREFRSPDFAAMRAALAQPLIFDGRNLYEPAMVRAQGFEYFPIGRK